MRYTLEEIAEGLNGLEYGKEPAEDIVKYCEDNNITIVYWYSDDCTEFRGAFYDELGSYEGGTFISNKGRKLEAEWEKDPTCPQTFATDIPHATFDVAEDDELYCIGIVFESIPGEKWWREVDDEYQQYLELKEKFE